MSRRDRMSPLEWRASIALSSLFGLRLFGMFVILPVFAIYAEQLPGGDDLTLVGIAIGAYGLTQAVLQIPFGWWSDRFGRKRVIYVGLGVFAAGSFVAAAAPNLYLVILGRALQGAGAISAAVMAMAADVSREEHRTKVMAMIGSTIGLAFAASLIASPWLSSQFGVPALFGLTGLLALAGVWVLWRIVPDVSDRARPAHVSGLDELRRVLADPQLARLNYGIFALHAVLMSLFIAVPFALRDAGLPLAEHWKVYLPVILGSFVLMLPPILLSDRPGRSKRYFAASVALLLIAQLALPWLVEAMFPLALFLLLFFTPFNVLEALLPSLTSKLAPPGAKGVAIGVYSSVQFLGVFVGAAAGGYLYGRWGLDGIVIADALLLVMWLMVLPGMRTPSASSTRAYTLPCLDRPEAEALIVRLRVLPGVREAHLVAGGCTARLVVDSAEFDEQNILRMITGKVS